MKYSITEFRNLEIKSMYEKQVLFDNKLSMRQRIYGLVDILDVAPQESQDSKCISPLKDSSDVNIESWFDPIIVDMMYICSNTMMFQEDKSFLGTFHLRLKTTRRQVPSSCRFLAFFHYVCRVVRNVLFLIPKLN